MLKLTSTGPRGLGRIRLSASPLMVAVALGMLGPAALEEDEDMPTTQRPEDDDLTASLDTASLDTACLDTACLDVPGERLDDLNVTVLMERLAG